MRQDSMACELIAHDGARSSLHPPLLALLVLWRGLILVVGVVLLFLPGCEKANSPEDAVRCFIRAARESDIAAQKASVDDDRFDLVRPADSREGKRGIYYFIRGDQPFEEGVHYDLKLADCEDDQASVYLLPGREPPSAFQHPELPDVLREKGLEFIVVRVGSLWKVSIFQTSTELMLVTSEGMEDKDFESTSWPPWWPGMVGLPALPSPPTPFIRRSGEQ